ncbi:uncharacterized protein LOC128620002 isoform X2 [Ictalurus furcatus]|uniref:uncharacterized protein LOC128620002 isoform X2 n=1 Tax=Ictalurus furcatus TaxID=66913 RepID=UPI002350D1DE|nr:uncharacterized protein LOC128620002 isoform X2 [Ictalurus furcatus]
MFGLHPNPEYEWNKNNNTSEFEAARYSVQSVKLRQQRCPEKRPEQRSIRKNERNADRHRPPARIRGQRETQKQLQGQKQACEQACCYDASTECTETSDNDYEMQIVEELHLARSNRQLHV